MEPKIQRTILRLAVEYFLLVLPILIYVSLEALHHEDAAYLLKSPEWSVATIFIVIQTIRIHVESIASDWNRSFTILLVIFLGVVTLAAGINIFIGLEQANKQSIWTLTTKWGLYVGASIIFLGIAGAGLFSEEMEE
jgi:hypothetical protein